MVPDNMSNPIPTLNSKGQSPGASWRTKPQARGGTGRATLRPHRVFIQHAHLRALVQIVLPFDQGQGLRGQSGSHHRPAQPHSAPAADPDQAKAVTLRLAGPGQSNPCLQPQGFPPGQQYLFHPGPIRPPLQNPQQAPGAPIPGKRRAPIDHRRSSIAPLSSMPSNSGAVQWFPPCQGPKAQRQSLRLESRPCPQRKGPTARFRSQGNLLPIIHQRILERQSPALRSLPNPRLGSASFWPSPTALGAQERCQKENRCAAEQPGGDQLRGDRHGTKGIHLGARPRPFEEGAHGAVVPF